MIFEISFQRVELNAQRSTATHIIATSKTPVKTLERINDADSLKTVFAL